MFYKSLYKISNHRPSQLSSTNARSDEKRATTWSTPSSSYFVHSGSTWTKPKFSLFVCVWNAGFCKTKDLTAGHNPNITTICLFLLHRVFFFFFAKFILLQFWQIFRTYLVPVLPRVTFAIIRFFAVVVLCWMLAPTQRYTSHAVWVFSCFFFFYVLAYLPTYTKW